MCDPTVEGLRDALDRALKLFGNKPRYAAVQRRGMMRDFSWKTAATAFEALYRDSL
jgi:starch synthase